MKNLAIAAVAAFTALGTLVVPVTASADGGCVPGDIAGQVPRLTRPSDNVCVPPGIAQTVQNENAAAAAGQGYVPGGGAYGPKTCVSGLVWREGYDGDAVCVSPQRRTETWQENANAGIGATGGLAPQAPPKVPPPGSPNRPKSGMDFEVTGTGVATTIDLYDPQAEDRKYNVALPFSRSTKAGPQSGELYQIVTEWKNDGQPGCRIIANGIVVSEQPVGGNGHCIWSAP